MGFAVPIANTLEILGTLVAAGTTPVETTGSGNTVTVEVQTTQAIAASDASKIGLAAFDSASFSVNASGFVSLNSPSTLYPWIDQGTSITVTANKNYFATAAVTLTLPVTPAQGDTIKVYADTASSVVMQASPGQTIRIGTSTSSVAGTLTNTQRGDYVQLVYRTTGALWATTGSGSWTAA